MDGISLAVGIVGLAGVFSSCLECFELFETTKSLQQDFEDLLLFLDCQKERLVTWGELVGMVQAGEEGKDPNSPVTRCLVRIISLLSDAEQLREKYGVRSSSTVKSSDKQITRLGSERLKKLRGAFTRLGLSRKTSNDPGLLLKTRWAIFDKVKFEALVFKVEKLVTELHRIVPVRERLQTKMVQTDIALLDVPQLRLVERVCEEPYPSWSDVASAIITFTQAGTTASQSVLSRHHQADHGISGNAKRLVPPPGDRVTFKLDDLEAAMEFYFVFTPDCFRYNGVSRCFEASFGNVCFDLVGHKGVGYLAGKFRRGYRTLGNRIVDSMGIKFDSQDLDFIHQVCPMIGGYSTQEAILPLATIYIYCAPCACSIRTALHTCSELIYYAHLSSLTRIDDRIDANCCSNNSKKDRLLSVLDLIRQFEASQLQDKDIAIWWVPLVDRVWLEQRLYQLEESDDNCLHASSKEATKELFSEFTAQSKYNGTVIVGELHSCSWMIQAAPFPWNTRMPRETEIFHVHTHPVTGDEMDWRQINWQRTYLGTFTPQDFSASKPARAFNGSADAILAGSMADDSVAGSNEPESSKRRGLSAMSLELGVGTQGAASVTSV